MGRSRGLSLTTPPSTIGKHYGHVNAAVGLLYNHSRPPTWKEFVPLRRSPATAFAPDQAPALNGVPGGRSLSHRPVATGARRRLVEAMVADASTKNTAMTTFHPAPASCIPGRDLVETAFVSRWLQTTMNWDRARSCPPYVPTRRSAAFGARLPPKHSIETWLDTESRSVTNLVAMIGRGDPRHHPRPWATFPHQ